MEYIIGTMAYIWAIIAIFFLILEMGSPGLFFFLSFFFGGLVAMGVSIFVASVVIQTTFFFIGTVCALFILRHIVVPQLGKGRPHEHTNIYALQGKRGHVVQEISSAQAGLVKVQGEKWVARSVHGDAYAVGTAVEIIEVRGAHVIVRKV